MEFDAEAFIVDEDANVVLTRDGWVKRVREVKDLSATRLREGDAVLAVRAAARRRSRWCSSRTSARAYVMRINDMPAVDRLRRSGAEAVQVRRRRARRRRAVARARPTRPRATLAVAVTQAAATACASRSRRTPSSRRAPAAATPSRPRATRSSASRACGEPRTCVCVRHQRRARAALQGRRDDRAGRAPAAASP